MSSESPKTNHRQISNQPLFSRNRFHNNLYFLGIDAKIFQWITFLTASTFPKLSNLQDLNGSVQKELSDFRIFFKDIIATNVPLLDQLLRYLWRQKGKEIRPTLVFMTAKLFGEVSKRTYVAATMIELLHTATLIHDDVVDEADSRRGFLSINKLWRNKAGVLLGDFLLSKGLLISLDHKEYILLKILSDAVRQMSEGELRQLKTSKLQNMTEDRYFDIISEKTASLIAACCHCGAESVLGDGITESSQALLLKDAGLKIGVAFQIKDDLLDYGTDDIGKPKRNDIQERKVTLPLIKALESADSKEAAAIRRLFRKRKKSRKEVEKIVQFVHNYGGIEASELKMRGLMDEAIQEIRQHPLLCNTADPSRNEALEALIELLSYIMNRKS